MGACKNSKSIRVPDTEEAVLAYLENAPYGGCEFVNTSHKDVSIQNRTRDAIKQLENALERARQAYQAGVDTLKEYKASKSRILSEIEQQKINKKNINSPGITKETFKNRMANLVALLRSDNDNKTKNKEIRQCISKIAVESETGNLAFYFFD
jgi:chromosome segregation ATPase